MMIHTQPPPLAMRRALSIVGVLGATLLIVICRVTTSTAQNTGNGQSIKNSIGMDLLRIPSGEFLMGSSKSPEEIARTFRLSDGDSAEQLFSPERPLHRVRITHSFFMGTYEVTKGQFRQFVDATGYRTEQERNGKRVQGYDRRKNSWPSQSSFSWKNWGVDQSEQSPVVLVTWNDATAFCQWLSTKEGRTYRLPTEAEWEYACRARTQSEFYIFDNPEHLTLLANVSDRAATNKFRRNWWPQSDALSVRSDDGWAFTCPVGQYMPNSFGLHDMHGNVNEWCRDWFQKDYYEKSPTNDPQGPDFGTHRIARGGSWCYQIYCARAAYRGAYPPDKRNIMTGFRVVLEVDTSLEPRPELPELLPLAEIPDPPAFLAEPLLDNDTLRKARGTEDR